MPRPRKPQQTLEELLREARALEETGGKWTAEHVAVVLGLSTKTIYRLPWLRAIRERRGTSLVAWTPAIVRRHHFLQQPKHVREMLRREEAEAAKQIRPGG